MKFTKPLKLAAAALAMLFTINAAAGALPVSARAYSDVPATSWAYPAVNRVTDLGFMSGDLSGNFNPNGYIDKFETTKILAAMAGYKETGATAAETEYYNSCYNKHIGFINLSVNKFKLWNSTVNKQIAFLLEKGIYVNSDLDQFVVLVNNKESLRALSREEIAVFLVRIMGRTAQLTSVNTNPFADDASITAACKPSVYYLRNIGVIAGGTDNKFSPKGAVLRVAMASFIDRAWSIMNPSATTPTPAPTATPTPGASYVTASGTIGKLFADFRAVQISSTDANNNKIFPVTSTAAITVNGAAAIFADLREGMSFSGLVSNGELISVAAVGSTIASTPVPTSPAGEIPASASVLEGTVNSVVSRTITIEVQILSPRGEVYTELRTFSIPADCVITRGGKSAVVTSIIKGDVVKASFVDGAMRKLEILEKDRRFSGEVVAKRVNETLTSSVPIITVKDTAGNMNDLIVTDATVINRRTTGVTDWRNVRVGDTVDVAAEYDKLITMYATGSYSTIEGYVREIHITSSGCELVIADDKNVLATYPLVANSTMDPYSFRIGSRLRLLLDSKEIDSFTVLQDASVASFSGIVTRVTASLVTVKDTSSGAVKEFSIDSATVVRDIATDKVVTLSKVVLNSRVYIATDPVFPTRARTISILQ